MGSNNISTSKTMRFIFLYIIHYVEMLTLSTDIDGNYYCVEQTTSFYAGNIQHQPQFWKIIEKYSIYFQSIK